jgi:hypothetical protein
MSTHGITGDFLYILAICRSNYYYHATAGVDTVILGDTADIKGATDFRAGRAPGRMGTLVTTLFLTH